MALNRPSIPPEAEVAPEQKLSSQPLHQRRNVRRGVALALGLLGIGGYYWVRETLTSIDMFMRFGQPVHRLHETFSDFDTPALENICKTTNEPPTQPMHLVYSSDAVTRARQEVIAAQIRADLNGLRTMTTEVALGTDTWFLPHLPDMKRRALCYRETATYLLNQLPN